MMIKEYDRRCGLKILDESKFTDLSLVSFSEEGLMGHRMLVTGPAPE